MAVASRGAWRCGIEQQPARESGSLPAEISRHCELHIVLPAVTAGSQQSRVASPYYRRGLSGLSCFRLPRNVMKSDIARYLVAYEYGGLYADYDVAAVGPLPEGDWALCLQVEHTLKQWSGRLSSSREKQYLQRIAQYFFAVEPHHDFFRLVLDESLRRMRQLFQENRTRWDDKTVLWATGPDVFTTIYHEHFENDTSVFLAERGALAKHQHEGVWKKGRDMLVSRRARRARRRSI